MKRITINGPAVGLAAAAAGLAGALAVVNKSHAREREFLRAAVIDERNQRMQEFRSFTERLNTAPMLQLDRSSPEVPQILPEDKTPYISDFEMDDERWEAFVEGMDQGSNGGGPVPFVESDE